MGVPETETSTHEREAEAGFVANLHWKEGLIAGVLAAIASGVAITLLDSAVLSQEIAGLYGFDGSLLAGWVAHVVHGALFGLVFAAVLTDPTLSAARKSPGRTIAVAVVFGLVLAIAGAGTLMRMWLGAVGVGDQPTLPHVTPGMILWHGVYGIVLGAVFATLDDTEPADEQG